MVVEKKFAGCLRRGGVDGEQEVRAKKYDGKQLRQQARWGCGVHGAPLCSLVLTPEP
jgi:hypothetical protein